MKRGLLSGVAMVLIASASLAAFQSVTLKRVPKVGQKINYTIDGSMTLSFDGASHTLKSSNTDSVTSVDTNGNFSVTTVQKDTLFDGQAPPTGAEEQTSKAVFKPSGEIVSVEGSAPGAADTTVRLQDLSTFYYPDKPLDIGGKWSVDVKPKLEGAVPVHADFTLVSSEKVGSTDTYKVDEDVKETGENPATMHNQFWVDPTDGQVIKQISEFTNLPLGPIVATKGKMTITKTG
jgi:hypothetical protein